MSDLPPVGELVQITYQDRHPFESTGPLITALGYVDEMGTWWTVFQGDLSADDVQSWCRVLVVPDTEETRERIAAAIHYVDWGPGSAHDAPNAENRWVKANDEGKPIYRAEADAVLAAVRGAAIR